MTKETNIPPFMEEALKSFKQFNFTGTDIEDLMSMYKKNIELMNSTQQVAIEATKAMMDLQRSYVQRAMEQWNEQLKATSRQGPTSEKTTSQVEATKDAVTETLEHIQELNSIIAKSNEKIKDSFQKRIKESLDETVNLANKNKKKK